MNHKITDYTEEEKDSVIDRLNLAFMRNIIKSSDKDMLDLINTYGGKSAILSLRMKKLGIVISEDLHIPEIITRLKKYIDS